MRKRSPSLRDLSLAGLLLAGLFLLFAGTARGQAQSPTPVYVTPAVTWLQEGQVNASSLNVRTGPHVSYTAVAYLMDGERVVLVGRNRLATWAQIEMYNGYRGWVHAGYLRTPFDVGALPIVDVDLWAMTAFVTNDPVPLFAGPGMFYGVTGIAQPGETLTLNGRTDTATWIHAILPGGQSGWVSATGSFIPLTVLNNLPIISPFLDAAPANAAPYYLVYGGPGMGYAMLDRIVVGQALAIEGRTADNLWLLVRLPDGRAGWIASEILRLPVPITTVPVVTGNVAPLVVGWQTGGAATVEATATPMPTDTPTSAPTATPTATTSAEATGEATPEATATAQETAEPTATAEGDNGGGNKQPQLPTATVEGEATATPEATLEPSATPTDAVEPTATMTPAPILIYVYDAPADDATPIQAVVPGQAVMLLGRTADSQWIKVRLDDDVEGWIRASVVQVEPDVSVLPVVEP